MIKTPIKINTLDEYVNFDDGILHSGMIHIRKLVETKGRICVLSVYLKTILLIYI
ncbi:hypothetical protein ANSO36C_29960 [Nostoc cf. commune SO-36]|uniref:Uncharacterized protein n=1 Tax=Nostoc cf. commune SO-36 TaxID=449208 RepID=A0ABN6Q5L6_NOSCO|nr:hypothetical protein ANSO36C_29960 [Nostoc cf. commune SO-36]